MNQSQCTLNVGYRIYPKILYFKSNVQKIILHWKTLSGKDSNGLEVSNFETY